MQKKIVVSVNVSNRVGVGKVVPNLLPISIQLGPWLSTLGSVAFVWLCALLLQSERRCACATATYSMPLSYRSLALYLFVSGLDAVLHVHTDHDRLFWYVLRFRKANFFERAFSCSRCLGGLVRQLPLKFFNVKDI